MIDRPLPSATLPDPSTGIVTGLTDAELAEDRRRWLADLGYRLRWWYGLAIAVLDLGALGAIGGGSVPEAAIFMVVLLNGIAVLLAPAVAARPTEDRLTAERVLRHPLESGAAGDRSLSDR